MPGFPKKIVRTDQLKEFLVRFLWYNVIHSAVNYPLSPEFIPYIPAKSYTRTDGEVKKLEEIFTGYDSGTLAVVSVSLLRKSYSITYTLQIEVCNQCHDNFNMK